MHIAALNGHPETAMVGPFNVHGIPVENYEADCTYTIQYTETYNMDIDQ